MVKKIAYRVRNWKTYNRSLINRGNLTLWFSEDAIKSRYQKSQATIEAALSLTATPMSS